MRWKARRRAIIACVLMAFIFTGFSARLIYLQVFKHDEYTAIAAQKHSIRLTVPSQRGMILDRNDEILATNVPVRKVIADGSRINNPEALAKLAAPFLGLAEDDLLDTLKTQIKTQRKSKVIVQELSEDKYLALQKAMDDKNLRGLYFNQATTRTYPNGFMLSQVIGYLARKNPTDETVVGIDGIERSMDKYLRGEDGFRMIEHDRTGREIVIYRGQEKAPRNGLNVQLTINMGLQAILENELDAATRELKPQTATGIILDPKTGEILAMSSRPTFDLNNISSVKHDEMTNHAIADQVEPGSVFKIVVASGALNEHVVNDHTTIYCENAHFAYGGRILRDDHPYGDMSVKEILMKSSNIGSAKMALMLGDTRFYDYVRRFGYGERTGVTLPGEINGTVHPPDRWDKLTITRMPMGQAVAVTPIQIVMAYATIANGGKLMRPQIVRSIKDDAGHEVVPFQPEVIRQVVPENITEFIKNALTGVVSDQGTAALAAVKGFHVAGKTGTAQKVNPAGGYFSNKYVVSFVGFLPVEDPRFVCLIMIDDPKLATSLTFGGLVAAPIFSRVAEKTARYLNLVPSDDGPGLPVASRDPAGATDTMRQ